MNDKLERKNIDKTQIDWNEHAAYWNDFDEAQDYTNRIFELLSKRIALDDLSILDFGCGTGLLTDKMVDKAKHIVAVDSAEKMIEVLNSKKYKNVTAINDRLSESTIENNPALKNKFDLIVAASVCAFLPNYEEVLSIIRTLLKPNGIFVQWDWLQNSNEPDFGFTEDLIRKHYASAGLEVDSISTPFYVVENEEKMEVIMAIGKL